MEHVLHPADVAAAIRDTLAGKRTKAQLGKWAYLAMLANDEGTTPYDTRHRFAIHAAVYHLMFMEEGPEYELDDMELQAMIQALEEVRHADVDAQLQATLRLLSSRIADAIRSSVDQDALKRFAVECARQVIIAFGVDEPILLRALYLAGTPVAVNSDEFTHLRQEVAARVEQWDNLTFQAQETLDRDGGSRDDYIRVFRMARAAASVLRALEYPADLAAAEACYEASHALDESQAERVLLEIAQCELLQ